MTAEEKKVQDDAFRYACALGRLCGGHASRHEVIWNDRARRNESTARQRVAAFKAATVQKALTAAGGDTRRAAAALGVPRSTLYYWRNK